MDRIILLSGPIASGKSTLARQLVDQFGMKLIQTRKWLHTGMAEEEYELNRVDLQEEGERLDRRTNGEWIKYGLQRELRAGDVEGAVVLDAVRTAEQIDAIRDAYGPVVMHVHVSASHDVLAERYERRQRDSGTVGGIVSYATALENQTELQVETLKDIADVSIDTERCTKDDVLVQVASHLRLNGEQDTGYVDVIIGGQYGSEGKGQIAWYLADDYDLLVRVGGPNAGHKVYEQPKPYTHHLLPSGTRRNTNAKLLIGPGAVLNVDVLRQEIADCQVEVGRLYIDTQAMIIEEGDIQKENDLKEDIGSTGQGVGAATSRRIMGRGKGVRLAKDIPELKPYICSAIDILHSTFQANGRVCLEGTQGTGLSIFHGEYPYVTSRDTTVSGCIAEAGISPARVRRVVMVCRTHPIRVESPADGTSGPMSQEIDFQTIAARSGIEIEELEKTERTSTTNRSRRIGEFDWALLRKASLLNAPTDVALTFTDYLDGRNRDAMRFEQLTPETIQFVQEVERVSGARVSLITTGFNFRSIIDRRTW